jgi:hypothetical protein
LEERWKMGSEEKKGEGGRLFKQKCEGSITPTGRLETRLIKAVQDTVTTATWVVGYLGLRGEDRKAYEEVIETARNAGRDDNYEEVMESQATLIFLLANQIRSQRKWNWVMLAVTLLSIGVAIILALSR